MWCFPMNVFRHFAQFVFFLMLAAPSQSMAWTASVQHRKERAFGYPDNVMRSELAKERKHELELQKLEQEQRAEARAAAERRNAAEALASDAGELARLSSKFADLSQQWASFSSALSSPDYASRIDESGTNLLRHASASFRKAAKAKQDCEAAIHGSTTKEYRKQTLAIFDGLVSSIVNELEGVRAYRRGLDNDVKAEASSASGLVRLQPDSAMLLKETAPNTWLCRDKYDPDFLFVADFLEMQTPDHGELKRGIAVEGTFYQANGEKRRVAFNGADVEFPFAHWSP